MIHTDDIQRMLIELETGKPPSLRTPEADAMRAQLQREVADIHARGGVVAIPAEWPAVQTRAAGGPGSGNFGHEGRPGEVGGSGPGGGDWKSPGGWEHSGVTWHQPLDPATGRPIPIHTSNILEAVALVQAGKVVELDSVKSAYTLIEKLADMANAAKAAGKKAPDYDLCQVSVRGTNMFCAESLRAVTVGGQYYPDGIPRLNMPQLGGHPEPGSEADKLPHDPSGAVDGSAEFISYLKGVGMKTTVEQVPAVQLRASQRELIGSKVQGMVLTKSFDPGDRPIFISSDNYIVDGHHRWAAVVGRDAEDGTLGNASMHVVRVNAPIVEVLHLANTWSRRFGIKQAAGVTR